eukprot:TRINITY_DN32260_c0_g1_i1.p1 TRINITY_DN32260_c0_g1~~TRINITY_DN32260_c0_g1_i1.p1  ORF type:complete len:447 (+),score=174.78 TRINITY_DN32260_c0_g1_i1:166-1506(+)
MSDYGSAGQSPSVTAGQSPHVTRSRSPAIGGGEELPAPQVRHETAEVPHVDGQEMEVSVVEKSKDHLKLKLSHVEASFANALRRVMISEVAMLAVDTVEVHLNDSVIHDEMLVHRVAMLPIQTFVTINNERVNLADRLVYPRDCNCGGYCEKCSVKFKIHVRCQEDQTRRTVTSFDMVNVHNGTDLINAHCQPVHHPHSKDTYPIVLVELAKGQTVEMLVLARKGIGKEHSKWNPTCTVAMQYVPEVTLNERAFADLAQSDKKRWVRFCPRKVYRFDPERNKVEVNPDNVNSCFFCDECTTGAALQQEPYSQFKGKRQLVAVRRKKDNNGRFEVFFTIETNGCMEPAEVLSEAWRVFYDKIVDSVTCLDAKLTKAGRTDEIINSKPRADGHSGSRQRSSSGGRSTSLGSSSAAGVSPAYSGASGSVVSAMTSNLASTVMDEDIPWN